MPRAFPTLNELLAHGYDDVIDVRSPAEFADDHVPGAISLPVLSNDERARVGTIYKQESAFLARKIGAALVARNAALHLEGPLRDKGGGWRPLVYCWRGGQRSGSFASILSQIGWRAETIAGGYKAYRALVVQALHSDALPFKVTLIDGFTGTGKTEVLSSLRDQGGQVIDLEALACHRGSLFGARVGGQPSQRAFETALAVAMLGLDPDRPLFLEAESSKIGNLSIPPSLWAAMSVAPRIVMTASPQMRARYLVGTYADILADRERLRGLLDSLKMVQGNERIAEWQSLRADGRDEDLALELIQHHYDPRYARHQARADVAQRELALNALDPASFKEAAKSIAAYAATTSAGGSKAPVMKATASDIV
jgi:tRNA 2-selenouridine synthase